MWPFPGGSKRGPADLPAPEIYRGEDPCWICNLRKAISDVDRDVAAAYNPAIEPSRPNWVGAPARACAECLIELNRRNERAIDGAEYRSTVGRMRLWFRVWLQ